MRVTAGRTPGRSHRTQEVPCQDAYAIHADDARQRAVSAVADGLGSQPLSHFGSQAATQAAVDHLAGLDEWDEAAMRGAFVAARNAVQAAAAAHEAKPSALATTLQVATLSGGRALVAMVGDGAIVAAGSDALQVLLAPKPAGYANEVMPLTGADWEDDLRFATADGIHSVANFTDGLTRLLLARKRGDWLPYEPFFETFLPQVRAPAPDFKADLVDGFLADERVDRAWDDDKCLVVLSHDVGL